MSWSIIHTPGSLNASCRMCRSLFMPGDVGLFARVSIIRCYRDFHYYVKASMCYPFFVSMATQIMRAPARARQRERERERERREKQTDRQTDRQAGRQAGRRADRRADRDTEMQTEIQRYKQRYRQKDKETGTKKIKKIKIIKYKNYQARPRI